MLFRSQAIKLHLLKSITEDFSEKMKIGSGGYGAVYKVPIVNHIMFVVIT